MTDEQLISAVEKRRTLYDVTHVLYKNNGYRRKIWNDIAIEIGLPVDVCHKKWKRLRERYTEINKKQKSGSAANSKKYSTLLVSMGFLKPFLKDSSKFLASSLVENDTETSPSLKEHISNESQTTLRSFFAETDPETLDDCLVDQSTSSSFGVVASTPKKKQTETNNSTDISELINILKEPVPEHDSIDHYCMSLACDLKKMEPTEQRRIRLEITKIMCTASFYEYNIGIQ